MGQFNTVLRFLVNEDNKLPLELHSIMFFWKPKQLRQTLNQCKRLLKALFSLSLFGSSHSHWPRLFSVNIKKMVDDDYKLENSFVVKMRNSGACWNQSPAPPIQGPLQPNQAGINRIFWKDVHFEGKQTGCIKMTSSLRTGQ